MPYIENEILERLITTMVEGFARVEKKLDHMNRLKECLDGDKFLDMFYFVNWKGVEGTSFRWFFYLKDMKTTEFFRENHRNRKNGTSFGNLYFRDTAFFSFRPISFSPHSSRSAKVLFSA